MTFRLMKNIIFNKTKSFVGRITSDHACQIFCTKSNYETVYHLIFLLEVTMAKIMKKLNVCSAHSYLYPLSRFNDPIFSLPSLGTCIFKWRTPICKLFYLIYDVFHDKNVYSNVKDCLKNKIYFRHILRNNNFSLDILLSNFFSIVVHN